LGYPESVGCITATNGKKQRRKKLHCSPSDFQGLTLFQLISGIALTWLIPKFFEKKVFWIALDKRKIKSVSDLTLNLMAERRGYLA
jgi:hypothetical protein